MSFRHYTDLINNAFEYISPESYNAISALKQSFANRAYNNDPTIMFGNGASASITEHMVTDWMKGVKTDTNLKPNLISLVSNAALMTAIGNDFGYENVFSQQLRYLDYANPLIIAISSSGSSPNVIKALEYAEEKGWICAALVGFDGGTIVKNKLANMIIHVPSNNYGVIEDVHSMIMHSIAQDIRKEHKTENAELKL